MALETGSFISDLVATNPAASDPKAEGDDHIRLIKSTVKASFPNISGAVTANHTELSRVAGVTSPIQTQIDTKAPINSPVFTGTPSAPTAAPGTSTTQLATTEFVMSQAFNSALPNQTGNTGKYLQTDGANASWQGAVSSVAMSVPAFLSVSGSPITSSGTLAVTYSGTPLPVANGGTGVTTSTGSGANVLSTSPTLTAPTASAVTPTSNDTALFVKGSLFVRPDALFPPSQQDGTVIQNNQVIGMAGGSVVASGNLVLLGDDKSGVGGGTPQVTISNSNLNITGTGLRIRGDFSNATIANRVMFQTSTANVATTVGAIPNGTDPTSVFLAQNNSDPTNAGTMALLSTSTEGSLRASRNGSGTFLPMTFYTNGSERMRIDTTGNVLVTNNGGGLGYGTGAGGTVTQATSKSTSVTLNRPAGQITMNNAALAAGASVVFTVNNSLVASADNVFVSGVFVTVDPSNYRIEVAYIATTGAFAIRVTNISAGSLSQALVINFSVIKGSST